MEFVKTSPTTSSRRECLRVFLNKKLGNKNFLATYTCSKNSNSLIVLAERKKFRFPARKRQFYRQLRPHKKSTPRFLDKIPPLTLRLMFCRYFKCASPRTPPLREKLHYLPHRTANAETLDESIMLSSRAKAIVFFNPLEAPQTSSRI